MIRNNTTKAKIIITTHITIGKGKALPVTGHEGP
jgi:hypothetical protein